MSHSPNIPTIEGYILKITLKITKAHLNQSNSKSKETIEVDVRGLLENHLKDNENIQLPIEGMNRGALTIGISYIPVKYGNAVESAVESSHKKIDGKYNIYIFLSKIIILFGLKNNFFFRCTTITSRTRTLT